MNKVGEGTVKKIINSWDSWSKEIEQAKKFVKNTRDKKKCKISEKKAPGSKLTGTISVAVHHLYSQSKYPHLAASTDNLITITTDIHNEFHAWNGGTHQSCTIDDFIKFVDERYPEADEARIWLNKKKQLLGTPQPSTIHSQELILPGGTM